MKNNKYLILISFILTFLISNLSNAQSSNWCHTDHLHQQRLAENPDLRNEMEALDLELARMAANNANKSQIAYTVPVVFHVIHENGPENIPSSQIKSMMEEINRDFQKLNSDTATIIPAFQGIIGNPDFQFRLATKDPNGNCTNGITRTFDPVYTNDARQNYRPVIWPREKYLNIWVVKQPGAGSAAFAYLPTGSNPAPFDGVVIGYQYTNPSNGQFTTTLSHEIGHYFNLYHTWGSQSGGVGSGQPGNPANCNDDDQVTDTPNTIGQNCSNQPSCGSLDNYQNQMDYCFTGSYMFTNGQVTRMHNIIPARTYRSNLVSASNLIATGTDDASYQTPACPPTADFTVNKNLDCEGGTFNFTDRSFHAFADASQFVYNWTFNGANPASSSMQNPSVSYNGAGTYDVALSVSLPGTSLATKTNTNFIEITPGSGTYVGPYLEQTNDPAWPNSSDASLVWTIEKPQGSLFQFQRSTNGFYSAPSSIYLNNFINNNSGDHDITTPLADLTNMQSGSAFFNFQLAHAQKGNEQEILRLLISTDCGESFSNAKLWVGNNINTAPSTGSSYVPNDSSEWKFFSHDISALAGLNNVQFKLRFTTNNGNNIWLDDIHISNSNQPVVSSLRKDVFGDFNLYPNPNEGVFTLEYNVTGNERVSAEIIDMIGKSTPIQLSENIDKGWNTSVIDTRNYNLKAGMYMLKLKSGDQVISKRLMIQ